MASFTRGITFATNGTITAENLHNLIDQTTPRAGIITDRSVLTTMSTGDRVLIADTDDATNAYFITTGSLVGQALSGGTYTELNLTGNLTFGTATGNRTVSTSATITTGTINNATLGTTTGTAATFTNATATSANITNGTIQTLTSSTATITSGTFSGLLNSSTGTFSGLTSGIINSTTGTIGNFTTTLIGDVTITQGTATLGTTGVTAGTYGTSSIIPRIVVDSKGRITTVSTSQLTPANSSITPSMLSQPLTLATAVASTSGTAIDFTGIPSWAKRVTSIWNGVSTNGTSNPIVRLGDGSIVSTGYNSGVAYAGGTNEALGATSTTGFHVSGNLATNVFYGKFEFLNISGNTWVANYLVRAGNYSFMGTGSIALTGVLDRVRITTVNGTDTFDAGSINIMYEG